MVGYIHKVAITLIRVYRNFRSSRDNCMFHHLLHSAMIGNRLLDLTFNPLSPKSDQYEISVCN